MTIVTVHASGSVDPDEAWARYAEPDRWAGWAPQIRRVETSADRIAPGVTGRVHGPVPGVFVDFVVDAVDELARRWSWMVRRGPLTLRLEHGVRARATGTTTSLRVDGPMPVVLGYAPVAHLALRRLVAH
ncbi:MAG TPA: hypothetical protein VGN18_00610 [Jatrophihabitans sp.]|uniref:SRPBCC family protein n=1 Tax=Jatrophihabitans sp. TaxID=1932789 RepID=UPI002E0A4731|nr:hypothetical protein [Jatrophihabitans sp.]